MANILNQDEIDSLLGAMDRGELDDLDKEKDLDLEGFSIKDYNFKRPSLITKDQLNSFITLHENFAREASAAAALALRTKVSISLISSEQRQYNEFISSLSKISYSIVFTAEPLPGLAILEFNLALFFGIEDILLGGQGDVETEIRQPTDIETSIVTPFIEKLIELLQQAWSYLLEVELKPTRQETDPEYIQIAPLDAPVLIMAFDAKIGVLNGIFNICYPLPMIRALLEHLEAGEGQMDNYYGKRSDGDTREQLIESIKGVPLHANTTLGSVTITGNELLSLKAGDIVILNKKISNPLKVSISGTELYDVTPGRNEERLCVRIQRIINGHQPVASGGDESNQS